MFERHLILFDGHCSFCRRVVERLLVRDRQGLFRAVPYQEAPTPPMTPALAEACARAVHLVRTDGGILQGARAVLFILEHSGAGFPARLAACPPLVWPLELGYRFVARNRPFFARFLSGKEPPKP